MNILQKCSGLVLAGLLTTHFYWLDNQGKLLIEVSNIHTAKGKIWVGVYDDPEHYFDQDHAIVKAVSVSKTGKTSLAIPALKYGTYAVALFHDLNGNGKLDQNRLGVPKEPYAFSKQPKTKWRLPKFEEIQFYFRKNNQVVRTPLQWW